MKRFDVLMWLAVLLTMLVGLSEIRAHWDWIGAITSEQQAFLGAVVGAFLGLVAILGGAFYNAKLNRDRDDRLREREQRALAAGLDAEFEVLLEAIVRRIVFIKLFDKRIVDQGLVQIDDEGSESIAEKLRLPPSRVFQANTQNLGLLGKSASRAVARVYTHLYDAELVLNVTGDVPKARKKLWEAKTKLELTTTLIKAARQALEAVEKAPGTS